MPTLNWIGKDKVVSHHLDVPYKPLEKKYAFVAENGHGGADARTQTSATPPRNSRANRIIHGDNLEALKALLPEFERRINCIYIDPPYNTGNEGWVYNDAVNDPKMLRWLGKVVGKEGEDLSRHDKWLCMMYPRLKLLHRLLADDGVMWISIDDNEVHHTRLVLDEIFGESNFIATVIWKKLHARNNSAQHFSTDHDSIVVYAKRAELWRPNKVARTEASDADFWNPDDDPRGLWRRSDLTAAKPYSDGHYSVTGPHGDVFTPRANRYWSVSKDTFDQLLADNRIWWGKSGRTFPFRKRFKSELGELVPTTVWLDDEVGNNREAKQAVTRVMGRDDIFSTPKPIRLIQQILSISAGKNAIVLDSFAGSGTTAHAALQLNAQDGGNRRFILVEMMDYAETITAERMRRVMEGYGEGDKRAPGLGGGFDFYTVGEQSLFDDDGNLDPTIDLNIIRGYVAWTEGLPPDAVQAMDNPVSPSFIGQADHHAVFFHYDPAAPTTLDYDLLESLVLPEGRPDHVTVYADHCTLTDELLKRASVAFKKIPRDVSRL